MQGPHEIPQLNGFLFTRFEQGFLLLVLIHGNFVCGAAIFLAKTGPIAGHEFRQVLVSKQLSKENTVNGRSPFAHG